MEEGYIKYHQNWKKGPPPRGPFLHELIHWRQQMYEAGLIGFNTQQGVGFGNISYRPSLSQTDFVISGTQTGSIAVLEAAHFTSVQHFSIEQNTLHCQGPIMASSEALTHAAVYVLPAAYQAVIHVHHLAMWEYFQDRLPTSEATVAYGTPAMAQEVKRLFAESALPQEQIMIMGGHEEGILAMGKTLQAAGDLILHWKAVWAEQG